MIHVLDHWSTALPVYQELRIVTKSYCRCGDVLGFLRKGSSLVLFQQQQSQSLSWSAGCVHNNTQVVHLLLVGMEASLWTAEQFAADLKVRSSAIQAVNCHIAQTACVAADEHVKFSLHGNRIGL